jgi:WD40 repeat protein
MIRAIAADKLIKLVPASSDREGLAVEMSGHKKGVNDVVFMHNNHIIASVSDDKSIKLWDAAEVSRKASDD